MRWLSVPCSQMGSLSCPIFSQPIVETQPQRAKAKAQKGQTEKETNGKGAKGRRLHNPGSQAVCGPYDLFSCLSLRDVGLHPFQLALRFGDYINTQ